MKSFRKYFVFRVFWLVMALHIFNCSVDAPDAQPESFPENLTYNDMESVVEIVLEQVFDIKNAITETDDNDNENTSSVTAKGPVEWYTPPQSFVLAYPKYFVAIDRTFSYEEKYFKLFHPEIVIPPPQS